MVPARGQCGEGRPGQAQRVRLSVVTRQGVQRGHVAPWAAVSARSLCVTCPRAHPPLTPVAAAQPGEQGRLRSAVCLSVPALPGPGARLAFLPVRSEGRGKAGPPSLSLHFRQPPPETQEANKQRKCLRPEGPGSSCRALEVAQGCAGVGGAVLRVHLPGPIPHVGGGAGRVPGRTGAGGVSPGRWWLVGLCPAREAGEAGGECPLRAGLGG